MQNIQHEDLVNKNADVTAGGFKDTKRNPVFNIYPFIEIPQSYYQEISLHEEEKYGSCAQSSMF